MTSPERKKAQAEAYESGYQAFRDGAHSSHNPYGWGDGCSSRWLDGWEAARREHAASQAQEKEDEIDARIRRIVLEELVKHRLIAVREYGE